MFRSSRRKIWHESLRDLLWPRIGVRRAWNYRICRLSRLRVCPHKISLGFALGAFASFTPFIGFHFVLAAVLAFVLRGNLLASAAGTVVGNPLTFPLIWIATFKLGNALTGGAGHQTDNLHEYGFPIAVEDTWWSSFYSTVWPMLVGAVPLGFAAAGISYAICYWSLGKIRHRNKPRIAST